MAFKITSKCRSFFEHIYDKENKDGTKLKLLFDEYYLCLMVGLAAEMYDGSAKLEPSEITDYYPGEYIYSKDYIAGLLIATERKVRGLAEGDSSALEKLMTEYLDPESKTRLTDKGVERLNQYAARGIDIMLDVMSKPYDLESFLVDYLECFEERRFFIQE
ncbi:hypothetical protein [Hungatella sp.]|uniref:hypothetical protein n=1 Tax=Hungatella sp. TaxID=2613924 RepID=UPI002A834EDE|nr:hypothetical protein [Hungatella sp.]